MSAQLLSEIAYGIVFTCYLTKVFYNYYIKKEESHD
jgi:hypothetical protein